MGSTKYTLFVVLLLTISFAGCTSEESSNEPAIFLSVQHSADSGMILESYSNGDKTSTTQAQIDFDFSNTTADLELATFGLTWSGENGDKQRNSESSWSGEFSAKRFTFAEHGWYNITAYVTDVDGGRAETTFSIKIDLRIEWAEANTDQPQTLVFDPEPLNGGGNAQMIEVNSVVENPETTEEVIFGGDSVGITWNIIDEQDDVCQKKSANIENGESGVWDTLHFNTFQVHELSITFDDDQETINVEHIVSIIY
jgi:hypothetical protein